MRKKLCTLLIAAIMMTLCPLQVSASDICNHDWSEWETLNEPTCGEIGTETRFCYNCYEDEYRNIPVTGNHDWDSWYTSKSATIKRTGIKKRECVECFKVQSKKISKLKPYIKLSNRTIKLQVSKTYTLKPKYANGDSIRTYKSSNNKVATVTQKGKIKAKRKGTTKITITTKSGKRITCTVNVSPKKKTSKKSTSINKTVYWVPNGSVYHSTRNCSTLSRSRTIYNGSKSKCPKSRACKVCH